MHKKEHDEWFTYTSFLVSSARAGIEESVVVSSHRLVEALRRLFDLVPALHEDPFFQGINAHLDRDFAKAYFKSPEEFTDYLDDLLKRFAAEARVRNAVE